MRDGIDDFVLAATQHVRGDRRRRKTNEDHMIQSDAIERILQRVAALDFVRLDRVVQYVANGQWFLAFAEVLARDIICHGENRAEVI